MLPRVFAILGLVLLGAGLVLPSVCPDGNTTCDFTGFGLIDPELFEDSTERGITGNIFGLLVVAVAVPGVVAAATNDRGAMSFSALTVFGTIVLNFGVVALNLDNSLTLSYGWAVLGAGALFLGMAAVAMPAMMVPTGAAVVGPRMMAGMSQPQQAAAGGAANMNKTRIDGVAMQPQGPQRTMIEPNFNAGGYQTPGTPPPPGYQTPGTPPPGYQPQPQNWTPPPPGYQQQPQNWTPPPPGYQQQQPQHPLPQMPGFGNDDINPLQQTMIEDPDNPMSLEELNPEENTAMDLKAQQPAQPADRQPSVQNRDKDQPASTPPENYAHADRTMIDKIAAPEPEEIDPWAWKKELEKQQEAEEAARIVREAAELARKREEEARQQADEEARKAAAARQSQQLKVAEEAERKAAAARQMEESARLEAEDAEAALERTNMRPVNLPQDPDSTNMMPAVNTGKFPAPTADDADQGTVQVSTQSPAAEDAAQKPLPSPPGPDAETDDADDDDSAADFDNQATMAEIQAPLSPQGPAKTGDIPGATGDAQPLADEPTFVQNKTDDAGPGPSAEDVASRDNPTNTPDADAAGADKTMLDMPAAGADDDKDDDDK